MEENYVYPVIQEKCNEGYLISFPDFPGDVTVVEDKEDVVKAAQEVLALNIIMNEDLKRGNPKASEAEEIELKEGQKLFFVHIWMPYYRQIQKVVYVKKTLTIPQWLDEMAKAKGINFSGLLVKALKQELGIGSKENKSV